jgi:carbon storage regulator
MMLALTRKVNEAIIIDGCIEIKILEVTGDKVKLGIAAPKEVSIYREEIYKQVEKSNQEALTVDQTVLASIKDKIK